MGFPAAARQETGHFLDRSIFAILALQSSHSSPRLRSASQFNHTFYLHHSIHVSDRLHASEDRCDRQECWMGMASQSMTFERETKRVIDPWTTCFALLSRKGQQQVGMIHQI